MVYVPGRIGAIPYLIFGGLVRRWKYALLAALAVAAFAVAGAALFRPTPVTAPQPIPTTTIAPAPIPHLLVIGDSYSGGSSEGGNKEKGWPVLAQTMVTSDGSRLEMELQARGGSGYVHVGHRLARTSGRPSPQPRVPRTTSCWCSAPSMTSPLT